MTSATAYVESVLATLKQRDPHQPEFLEAATTILKTVVPVFEKHPEYMKANILGRLVEPERAIQFAVAG